MEQTNLQNSPSPVQKLPSGINVLTILTFIGCALALIGSIWNYFSAASSLESMENLNKSLGSSNGLMKALTSDEAMQTIRKAYENRLPILLVGIAGALLCFMGALQMRKLKKQGFYIWLVGELLPPIAGFVLVGMGLFGGLQLLSLVVPAIFIILYSVQLKHMH